MKFKVYAVQPPNGDATKSIVGGKMKNVLRVIIGFPFLVLTTISVAIFALLINDVEFFNSGLRDLWWPGEEK